MERFFDGTDQENSKTQGGKGQVRKIQKKKKKKERMEERKKKKYFLLHTYVEVPILVCSPSVRNALQATALMQPSLRRAHSDVLHPLGMPFRATALVQPSLRRAHSYGNLPYNLKHSKKILGSILRVPDPCIHEHAS
jgi:hypothetical protein